MADSGVPSTLERNIRLFAEVRRREQERRSLQERIAIAITRFCGSLPFVYLHAAVFGLWILVNTGVLPILPRFDPSLVILAMAASVEAIFLTSFVLIAQNRMERLAERRAELDLQMSLLTEDELTRLARVVDAIARRLGVTDEAEALREVHQEVPPERVLERLEKASEEAAG